MKSRPKANGQKQAKRLKAVVRNTRILNLKMKREQLIPTRVLKALSELHLPKNKKLYTKELNLLLSLGSEPHGDRHSGGCATANAAAAGSFSHPSSGQLLMIPLGDGHSGSPWCSTHGCRLFCEEVTWPGAETITA